MDGTISVLLSGIGALFIYIFVQEQCISNFQECRKQFPGGGGGSESLPLHLPPYIPHPRPSRHLPGPAPPPFSPPFNITRVLLIVAPSSEWKLSKRKFWIVKKQEYVVNPYLDPVLLVPGIAGLILHAVDEEGKKVERVWIRILGADHEFRTKLWSRFDPSTGDIFRKSVSLDEKTRIVVPKDRYGLYAIDTLDPDMIVGSDCVGYYHDMIVEMIKWGYQEGSTLFGFGYDFRQRNRLKDTMEKFQEKLETAYNSAGERKLTVITHSMGGLLLKCFMSLHNDIFEKYVKRWIAIAAPFQGAPGYITTSLLNGMSFVDGWEANFFISKWSMQQLVWDKRLSSCCSCCWSMQQLLIECPSIYELMASPDFDWHDIPVLQMWRQRVDNSGQSSSLLESYGPKEAIPLMAQALSNNKVSCGGTQLAFPLNTEMGRRNKRDYVSC
ncbi:hypothetical protein LUZ61_012009 [Rhynchospora tenuis]|uniref:Uncharacterized protein n=1 Tax=Rhynchospora tenuis TaxID=198213 RepID=A0AAD6A231_9POAL|nr:hypothetical protein LUZ61_012009 [Rhynchospora tenuis]